MEKFLTREEFSGILDVSVSTLVRGIKEDKWPFNAYVKIGRRIRYPASVIKELEGQPLRKEGATNDSAL
jgi:hypothetical protein